MSEPATESAPVTPEVPVTTESSTDATVSDPIESAIMSSMDEAGLSEDSTPEPVSSPALGTTPPAEVDELAKELGLAPGSRNNRIPYSRVQRIVENARKKAADEHAAVLKEHTEKLTAYEHERAEFAAVEQLILSDPEKFVESLVQMNPAYRNYFSGGGGQGKPRTPADMPQPDLQLQDGSLVYSPTAQQQLLQWQAQQTEQRLTSRIAPIEQRVQQEQFMAAALPKVQAQIAEAKTWPLFNENQADVLKALKDNPKISLEQAYQKVVMPKLAADRSRVREEVLAELNARPHSTSQVPSVAQRNDNQQPEDLDEVIRRAAFGR